MKTRLNIILLFLLIGSLNSCTYVTSMLMAIPEKKVIEKHRIENYKVKLVRKQGWAGPAWYGYEIQRRIIGINMPKKYYWYSRDSIENCIVFINDGKLVFDKCNKYVIKNK